MLYQFPDVIIRNISGTDSKSSVLLLIVKKKKKIAIHWCFNVEETKAKADLKFCPRLQCQTQDSNPLLVPYQSFCSVAIISFSADHSFFLLCQELGRSPHIVHCCKYLCHHCSMSTGASLSQDQESQTREREQVRRTRAVYIHGLLQYVRLLIIHFYFVVDIVHLHKESYYYS